MLASTVSLPVDPVWLGVLVVALLAVVLGSWRE